MQVQGGPAMLATVAELLESLALAELAAQLEHEQLEAWANEERVALLARLKQLGLSLKDRQAIANGVSRARREGRIVQAGLSQGSTNGNVERTQGPAAPASATTTSDEKCTPAPGIDIIDIESVDKAGVAFVRIFVTSDLHCDHPANMEWLRTHLPHRRDATFDVCLCAGDVSDKHHVLQEALQVWLPHVVLSVVCICTCYGSFIQPNHVRLILCIHSCGALHATSSGSSKILRPFYWYP